jgi:pimeloyl-ACP methyl ester carboxylesterase
MASRLATVAAASAVAAAAGGLVALTSANRRWAAAPDPTGGDPLRVPDGVDEQVVTADGAKLATLVAGPDDGPTYVLVHGWTNDRRVWGPVAQRLVDRGKRVVLYDQRGHGSSTVGDAGYGMDAIGADLGAVLDHVDAEGAVVAGHSMGGMAAEAFAVGHPEQLRARVRALALVSTSSGELAGSAVAAGVARRALGATYLDRLMAIDRLGPLLVRRTVGRTASLAHLRSVRDLFTETPPETRAGFFSAMNAMDFSERLAGVDVPTVVVCGTRDNLTPLRHSRRLAELLPNARIEVLPDRGHMLPCEAPDEVAELLAAL